ncbi:MAG: serine/threonine-protein phosphatase [Ruminococcus sp.]|nr:serine/threonine-protein phosphatase [Ruminococcus sp.]
MREKLKSYFQIYESEDTRKIFEKNEFQSNRLVSIVMIESAIILVIAWILNMLGIFEIEAHRMNILVIQGLLEIAVPYTLYKFFNGQKRWLKYVMVIALLLVCTRLYSILNYNVILIMVIPIFLSSRYFSKGFTVIISAISMLSLGIATVATVFYGIIDLNFLPSPADGTVITVKNGLRATLTALGADTSASLSRVMLGNFFPRLLIFMIIDMIAVLIAEHGHNMVLEQSEISKASSIVKAELNTANQIQNSMVPNIFPAFPDRDEFEVYAKMYTAKEVGGDFYDYFLVDDNHLALVIADVSGKGVPAALFMMATKILVKERTLMGGTPAEILEFVNERICSNNEAEMFVTVWLGILEINTGKVIAANAGHEYPLIYKNGDKFELIHDKHGFVIGGMDGIRYKNYEFKLDEGDTLFLYTDGVTEANNEDEELFGVERMLNSANTNPNADPEEIIKNIKNGIDSFVGNTERFDDFTMLCLKYQKSKS